MGKNESDKQPSDLELQVLSVLWREGPMTVRQVLEKLPDGRARAYTTVLTIMQIMERKGFVSHTQEGTAHVYKAVASQGRVLSEHVQKMVMHAFGGSRAAAIQQLLGAGKLSEGELEAIAALIEKHKSGGKGKG